LGFGQQKNESAAWRMFFNHFGMNFGHCGFQIEPHGKTFMNCVTGAPPLKIRLATDLRVLIAGLEPALQQLL
jgi:hypothetical protein